MVVVGGPSVMLGGKILRKLVSEDPQESIVKPTQREENSSGGRFFSPVDFQTFCV